MMRKCLVLVGLLLACAHQPSEVSPNRHGYRLAVIDSVEAYRRTVTADPAKRLVDLEREIPGIRLDIRYATENNFMKRALYPVSRAFLRAPAAAALRNVQEELRQQGLAVKVFDAYRPYRVTVAMWEPIKNPDYVADPAKGSRHNRGCAVDLTLISLPGGEELPMPTP